MNRALQSLVALACRRPRLVSALALLLVVGAGLFVSLRFQMNTDAAALISAKADWRQAEDRMDLVFPQNGDTTLVVVDAATPELAESATARLAQGMFADRAHFRRVMRPDGGEFFGREGLLFLSRAEVAATTEQMVEAQPFLGPIAADPSLRGIATTLDTTLKGIARGDATLTKIDKPLRALAETLDAQAEGQPSYFSWQRLFADSGTAPPSRRMILTNPVLDYGDLMPGKAASDAIRAIANSLRLDQAHGVRVRITGPVPLSDEEFSSLEHGAGRIAAVMILAMLVTLRLATVSWQIVAAILIETLAGLVVTTAIGLAAVGQLNLISLAFIPLFVGLGVDFGIQLSVRFQAERLQSPTPAAAMIDAAGALAAPLMLAAGAVCLGFMAFLPTDYVGVAELGVIAGLGMVVALMFSVTLLPALLMLKPPATPRAEMGNPRLAAVDRFLVRRRSWVLGLFGISMLLSIGSLFWVRFDFNPLHLRDPNGEAMSTIADLMQDPERDPNTIDILMPNLHEAKALAARLDSLPEVGRTLTAASFVPDDQTAKLALIANAQALLSFSLDPLAPAPPPRDSETIIALRKTAADLDQAAGAAPDQAAVDARRLADAFGRLGLAAPARRAAAEQTLIPPLEIMLDQMRQALAAQPISIATLPQQIRDDWIAKDGEARIEVAAAGKDRSDAALKRFVTAVHAIAPAAIGAAVSMQGAAQTIAHSFIKAGLLALVTVSLLLMAVLRSLRETTFTLAPVVLSGFLTLGTCVLIGQPINFANIIAFPLLFGVGVAFHIYFVMAWRAGATDLLQSSLARAVFFSALATGSAFGSLCLSHHVGTASMGKVLMISLVWTLVCALIFEPALLGPQRK